MRLPPLSALRAFESVARLGSVTHAAQELHVTHSAISHQIKLLESYIGIALIDRKNRRMGVTPEGRLYAYQVRLALQQLSGATHRMGMRSHREHLTIAVLPSFAMHWLIPRLADFYAKYPNWRIELVASLEIVDFDNSSVDCAVRFGSVETQGVHSEYLMAEWQVLVAGIHDARYGSEQTAQEVVSQGGLINANEAWSNWCQVAQLDADIPVPSLVVNDSNLALQAARSGLGVVLTRLSIAQLWLEQSVLKRVTPILAPHPSAYHLVWPNRSHKSQKLTLFADWIKEQCQIYERAVRQPLVNHRANEFGFLQTSKLDLPLKKN